MSDLIERKKALDEISKIDTSIIPSGWVKGYVDETIKETQRIIRTLPSAESERKIIYCKDCKFAHLTIKGEVKYCDVWFPEEKMYLSADDFCSSAEKRGE